jgi:hypothetical protein
MVFKPAKQARLSQTQTAIAVLCCVLAPALASKKAKDGAPSETARKPKIELFFILNHQILKTPAQARKPKMEHLL